jgi:hypothetical protein
MSSSKLAVDPLGRLVCVVTVAGPAVHVGEQRRTPVDLLQAAA